MAAKRRFDPMRGIFGLLPTPYSADLQIHTDDLRSTAEFCCRTGQHGIVWPVMVGEFYYLGESERVANLAAVLETVNGRLPVVFGCSGISVPQVIDYARAAAATGADAIIAMLPNGTDAAMGMDMFRRLGDAFEGPIMIQNTDLYTPLVGEQIAQLVDEVPHIEYVKEERQPGPKHIAEVKRAAGKRIKTIFGGDSGKFLPAEMVRGADGCFPACHLGDVLVKVIELWWEGQMEEARALHRRLLPLINLPSHSFHRYMLKRRGVISSTVTRVPEGSSAIDVDDRREITVLLEAIEDKIEDYPFGQE